MKITVHAIERYKKWQNIKWQRYEILYERILEDLKTAIPIRFKKKHMTKRLLNHDLKECYYFLNEKKGLTFTILNEPEENIVLTIGSMRYLKMNKDVIKIDSKEFIYDIVTLPLRELKENYV